uniref:Elongator complex protein 1 n=1 Tax=Phallusia mammillata TaxID=59560 RepID=A0A6F9DBA4_9ASCI|nr:putative elongator complex protein 1 [Phallusia mammillata]
MKNLKLLYRERLLVKPSSKFFTNNHEASKFFIADDNTIEGYNALDMQKLFDLDLKNPMYGIDAYNLCIVGLQFMYGEEQICVAMQHGEIALCNILDQGFESTGMFDCKLNSMHWSPDQEIALLVTDRGSVVLLTHDFDPIQEIDISTDQFGEGKFVNVGWGSKETQFQGSAGKYVPGKTAPAEKTLFTIDDQETKVEWRGDGQYFSISNLNNNEREVRIWNRDGELQYTCEKLAGLESAFAWKPSGALIATTQRKVHRHDVVFFELNGLQHGEFTLPFDTKQVNVQSLAWNADSSILMVIAQSTLPEVNKTYLQLWYCTNYHWSLKQCLEFDRKVKFSCWDSEHPFSLHVITGDGYYLNYKWAWMIDAQVPPMTMKPITSDSTNTSSVAVIDGNFIKLTPFATMSVPPPMCAHQFKLQDQAAVVCFCQSNGSLNQIGVLTNKAQFLTLEPCSASVTSNKPELGFACDEGTELCNFVVGNVYDLNKCHKQIDWQTVRHPVWSDFNTLIAAAATRLSNSDCLLILKLNGDKISCEKIIDVEGFVIAITTFSNNKNSVQIVYQNHHGKIFHCTDNDGMPMETSENFSGNIQLPCLCPRMSVCSFGTEMENSTVGLLSLSPQKQLFLDNVMINSECTSFAIHSKFVLITTSSHKLIAISRKTSFNQLIDLYSKTTQTVANVISVTEVSRSVERGSTIVVVTPWATKVVLQMPRGNLEVIHPRPLVLSILKELLDLGEYKQAFMIMRKHRINMNLFHDHNPEQFCKEIARFVKQLDSTEYLNIFLSDLREENVTTTLYQQYYPTNSNALDSLLAVKSSKVDKLCDLVLSELTNSEQHLYSILTAHVRKSKPEIDAALNRVKSLKESNKQQVSGALQHLHVMVDARVLYREALATYDLELALMVAQVSNDDPKEYIPFLNELKQLEINYMKYKIDMFLNKFVKALENIANCPDHFDECTELIKSKELYKEAMNVFDRFSASHKEICKLYAEFLISKQKYKEAGTILFRCNLYKRALKCYAEGSNWELALSCAACLQYSEKDYCILAMSLAQGLLEQNHHLEAANVFVSEAKDPHAAVNALVKGCKWAQALQIVYKYKMNDCINDVVKPAIQETASSFTSTIANHRDNFDRYYTRLMKVREIKKEKRLRMQMTGEEEDLDSDIASDFGSTITSSSQGSRMSRASGRSAKTRRKQQRNKYSLREGSRFEEEGLLQAIHTIIKQLAILKDDINSVISHLALFYLDDEACQLQKLHASTVKIFTKALPQIWTLPDESLGFTGAHATVNSILGSQSAARQEEIKLSDLEIWVPPKIDSQSTGMHMYE